MFRRQSRFARNFYDVSALSTPEREALTIKLVAALHNEISSLLSSVNFKSHRPSDQVVSKSNVTHECVDSLRYILAIMDVWGISSDEFRDRFDDRDQFLNLRHDLESTRWEGQPVIIIDIDDVLSEFKLNFTKWLKDEMNIEIIGGEDQYYPTQSIADAGYSPDELLTYFIDHRGLRSLDPIADTIGVVNRL